MLAPFRNVAEQQLRGFDLQTMVAFDLGRYGQLDLGGVASYLDEYRRRPAIGQPFEDLAGHDGVVDWRASSTVQWSRSDISIGLTAHYVDSYDRPAADDEIASWTSFDARLAWSPGFLKGGVLTGGVDNLFDRAPPPDPFFEGWPFVNRALHDNRGRFAFLEYRHSL